MSNSAAWIRHRLANFFRIYLLENRLQTTNGRTTHPC